jgi:hypothetical protein
LSVLLRALCVLCGYYFFAASVVAAPQDVVPVDGAAFAGELLSIEADGQVTFRIVRGDEAPPMIRTIQLDELVRWGHPLAPRPQTIVVLAGGGQLVTAADWSGGAAVRLEGDEIVVLSDAFGEVRLPRSKVRACVFAQRHHPDDRAQLVEQARSATGDGDSVWLTNEDRLDGTLTDLARGSLTMKTEGGSAKIPLSRVEAVGMGSSHLPSAVRRQARYAVGLRDGSLVYAEEAVVDEKALNLKIGGGIALAGESVADVVFLQSLGGRVIYLSDLEPAEYRHVPYLEVGWPLARDRNVLGGPLVVGGKRYLKGLGMHAAGRVSYRLDGKYQRFEAAVAIDDAADGRGSVTFGVYVLRDGKLSEAYKSGIVRGGDTPQRVSVDVAGAQGITLVVDYADRGDEMDRADWLDARLVTN